MVSINEFSLPLILVIEFGTIHTTESCTKQPIQGFTSTLLLPCKTIPMLLSQSSHYFFSVHHLKQYNISNHLATFSNSSTSQRLYFSQQLPQELSFYLICLLGTNPMAIMQFKLSRLKNTLFRL